MTDERPVAVALENRLMSHGIYVESCQRLDGDGEGEDGEIEASGGTRPAFALEYEAVAEPPVVTSDEVGAVVRTLLSIADEREWTPGRLEATSLTTDGDLRGRWHVEADWFDRLGIELSDVEFSERVLETVTTGEDHVN
ncbi:hypothetical protein CHINAEXTREME_12865 [Halobiforma lacisalsi AJ5]|uniref:DUF8159 domain-containing protein n=1 Tax=Natronobacterium lacisalsi AJ5 TaxID=358396 RepID=M0LHC1_NATLA|nr:hypothetical protein [Halobiforma lacisalsi]APW98614.1 hypothetical protein CHINAEXTREME_12865 [Halobiforma lacisalsi AJ5]EMA32478.1 hypothetical protein C445_10192 [Halobiforma lacisalsi AJ5]